MKNKILKTSISVLLSLLIATSCCVVMAEQPEVDLAIPEVASAEENAAFWQSLSGMSEEELSVLYEQLASEFTEASGINMQEELGEAELNDGDDEGLSSLQIIAGLYAMCDGIAKFDIKAPLDWMGKTASTMMFKEKVNQVLRGISELNRKADAINKKLDQVEQALIKLGKQAEVNAVENDLQTTRAATKELKTFVDEFRASALSKEGATDQERVNAFTALMNTHYPKVYTDLNNLAHYLYDRDNIHTKNSLFYNLAWLAKSNNFAWDTWEMTFQQLNVANFTVTYLEALSYVLILLAYSRDMSSPGSMQRQDYDTKLTVTYDNFNNVIKEMDANKIKPIGGSDDTISFNFGQGKYLTLSKHLRGLGKLTGVSAWKYPEGLNSQNINRDSAYKMVFSKEKLTDSQGKTQTLYALAQNQYKIWGDFIYAQGNNIGIDPKIRPYDLAKNAGFYMGNSTTSNVFFYGYAAGLKEIRFRIDDKQEYEYMQGIYSHFGLHEKDTFADSVIYALSIVRFEPKNDGLTIRMGMLASNLLMYLTPVESVGEASNPYTLERTTLDNPTIGGDVKFDLVADNPSWMHGSTEGLRYVVGTGEGSDDVEIAESDEVYMNNERLDPSCYEIDGESITLKPSYLETLTNGIYELKIVQPEYQAVGGLYVIDDPKPVSPTPSEPQPANNGVPKTGDGSNIPYIVLTAMLCAVAFVFIKRKKINK